jgi:NAD-dependent deacetylase
MGINSIVVLTGAGVSAESGLNTFRDADGLWEGHKLENVCTPKAFKANPELVNAFYNARRAQILGSIQPNSAHLALAEFEAKHQGSFTLITQNVDNLHERAGNRKVYHMHGELLKARCQRTLNIFDWDQPIVKVTLCPCCNESGTLRPHIVWFGEIPFYMFDIEDAIAGCDIFVAIGTSGSVYPAANLVTLAQARGATTIELNLAGPSGKFEQHIQGPASRTVPELFQKLLVRAG